MSTDTRQAGAREDSDQHSLVRAARIAGLSYLGLAITGALGFLVIRSQLFVAGDATATLANLVEQESLARAGVTLEMLIVLTQALAAAWFYRLFRTVDSFSAAGIAAFGLINSIMILVSAALLGTAVELATGPGGGTAATVQLLYLISGNVWNVGGVFFGLWLIPMGWCALRSGMPRLLGWILIGGGVGYVLSAFIIYLGPGARGIADALVLPATVGEFWMIGYLLFRGAPRRALDSVPPPESSPISSR